MRKMRNKRSQEEMVGFILIIVLVAIIALVFLVISLRKPVEVRESVNVEDFLYSSLYFTTSCQQETGVYDFRDVIKACYHNEKCSDGKDSCEVLNETSASLIEAGFKFGEEAEYKAYAFKIRAGNSSLVYLSKGNYTGTKTGGQVSVPMLGESFNIQLELYS